MVGQGQGKQQAVAKAGQTQHLEQRRRQQGRSASRRPVEAEASVLSRPAGNRSQGQLDALLLPAQIWLRTLVGLTQMGKQVC